MLHTILNLLPLRIPPLVESNNKLAVSNHIVLNDYFASVFTTDDGLLPVFPPLLPVEESLSSVLFSFDKVFKTLKALPQNAPLLLMASPLFVSSPAIAYLLTLLYMSMRTEQIPLVWKTALVCSVFKKGSHYCQVTIDLSHKRASLVKLWKASSHLLWYPFFGLVVLSHTISRQTR